MSRKLILIGGVHTDVDGESRLVKAIEDLRPSDLSIEALKSSIQIPQDTIDLIIASVRGDGRLNLDEEKLQTLTRYLRSYGYELSVAQRYKAKWSPQVHLVDVDVPYAVRDESSDAEYAKLADAAPEIIQEYKHLRLLIANHLIRDKKIPKKLAIHTSQ